MNVCNVFIDMQDKDILLDEVNLSHQVALSQCGSPPVDEKLRFMAAKVATLLLYKAAASKHFLAACGVRQKNHENYMIKQNYRTLFLSWTAVHHRMQPTQRNC